MDNTTLQPFYSREAEVNALKSNYGYQKFVHEQSLLWLRTLSELRKQGMIKEAVYQSARRTSTAQRIATEKELRHAKLRWSAAASELHLRKHSATFAATT